MKASTPPAAPAPAATAALVRPAAIVTPTTVPVPPLEELLSLPKAARLIPTKPHYKSLIRHHKRGRRGFRLRIARDGHRVLTTAHWLSEFFSAIGNGGESAIAAPAKTAEPAADRAAKARRRRETLRAEGLRE